MMMINWNVRLLGHRPPLVTKTLLRWMQAVSRTLMQLAKQEFHVPGMWQHPICNLRDRSNMTLCRKSWNAGWERSSLVLTTLMTWFAAIQKNPLCSYFLIEPYFFIRRTVPSTQMIGKTHRQEGLTSISVFNVLINCFCYVLLIVWFQVTEELEYTRKAGLLLFVAVDSWSLGS